MALNFRHLCKTCVGSQTGIGNLRAKRAARVATDLVHKTEAAKRLRGRIENVLSWATVTGHRTGDNPDRWKGNLSKTLPKPSKIAKPKNQPALKLEDMPRWCADLSKREGMAAHALRFLTMTAARFGEVRDNQ